MNLTTFRVLGVAVAFGFAGLAPAAHACSDAGKPPPDHEQARAALKRGEVMPLRRVLETVERQSPGDILKIELFPLEGGAFAYKLKILARDGRVVKQCLDARTAAPIACPEPPH